MLVLDRWCLFAPHSQKPKNLDFRNKHTQVLDAMRFVLHGGQPTRNIDVITLVTLFLDIKIKYNLWNYCYESGFSGTKKDSNT